MNLSAPGLDLKTTTASAVAQASAARSVSPETDKAMHKAAQDFTSVFMSQMLSQMHEGQEPDDTFGGGKGEEMYRSMLDNEYGKSMAASGSGTGMTNDVYRQMLKLQEGLH